MTESSNTFCIKWNEFQTNIVGSYQDLRNNCDFSDVTLVSDDGRQTEGHRIILSASSPVFNAMLKSSRNTHTMIYMRGLKTKDIGAIMDFIYNGEANIYQEDLDRFLTLAEELQLKGLDKSEDKSKNAAEDPTRGKLNQEKCQTQSILKQEKYFEPEEKESTNMLKKVEGDKLFVPADATIEDIRIRLDDLMERVNEQDQVWRCTVCGKETKGPGSKTNLRSHIEIHMEGLSYTCNQCGKISRSSRALGMHISRKHKN